MSYIIHNNTIIDPFILENGGLTITEIAEEKNVLVDEIFHKEAKLHFKKTILNEFAGQQNQLPIADLIPGGIIEYVRSKFLLPIDFNSVNEETPSGTPTYSFNTVRNELSDFTYQDNKVERLRLREINNDILDELSQAPFYHPDATEQRNIVFNSIGDFAGVPESDVNKYSRYNIFDMRYLQNFFNENTYQGISNEIKKLDLAGDGHYNIFGRLCVLAGHYGDNVASLGENTFGQLTLKTLIDNYNYPFPIDAYYPMKANNIEYDMIHQEYLKAVRRTISMSSFSYSDILNKERSPNEILFFRVEKWFSQNPAGTPDQVFFIPATDSSKRFIDTQIKGNKNYYYRATVYYSVIESEYFFTDIVDDGETGSCIVQVRPSVKIYNQIAFEGSIINTSAPPLPPYVSFHVKQSEKNKIKMYLELQKGQRNKVFIGISGDDQLSIGPNYLLENNEVMFKYTKDSARFQVFRTTNRPQNYSDFFNKSVGTFENNNDRENMIIMDNVVPNKKYYYTFRTINQDGSFSNPTPVFEVELIKDSDSKKVSVNVIEINENIYDEEMETSIEMNFRSLLQIKPAPQQLAFNIDEFRQSGLTINSFANKLPFISLGNTGDSTTGDSAFDTPLENNIWGNKFKFRVKSNDSGKIIDFNVNVNLIKQLTEEDFS